MDSYHGCPCKFFSPDTNLMTTLVKVTNTKNVWSFDLNQNTRKQLTFGSIGSATLKQQKVYFQYVGQQGLWVMDRKNSKIEQHTENLQPNSKLLSMDESGVYYINGSICQESDIFYQQFDSEDRITFLPRANKNTQTSDFNHQKGALTTQCQLGKSNIMRYE